MPAAPRGIVLFAHGSGSSRHSPRNVFVARALHESGVGTLLFDLLTVDEDRVYETRFDIGAPGQSSRRGDGVAAAAPRSRRPPGGLFRRQHRRRRGAARRRGGGRAGARRRLARRPPDLAGAHALARVAAPTLLIVGGDDPQVIALNRQAYADLQCTKALEIVPGATHLFEEPGTLEQVATLAAAWFRRWLGRAEELRTPG